MEIFLAPIDNHRVAAFLVGLALLTAFGCLCEVLLKRR